MTPISFRGLRFADELNGKYLSGFRCLPGAGPQSASTPSYTPAGGELVPLRVSATRPDAIVGFGETRFHAETATVELRASEVADPRPDDQLTVGSETFVVQGEPERQD
jgi:hypothetical protein